MTNGDLSEAVCCQGPATEVTAVENSLAGFFANLFDTASYPPRWNCGTWTPLEGWLHIVSDLAIFAAYFAIPISILWFAVKRKDVPFNGIFFLFAAFILLCGGTHLLEAVIFYVPLYRVAGLLKLATALVSIATFFVLVRILPQALELPKLVGENEHLQQLTRAKSDFLANMSHEIRTPMTAILGNVDLLDDRDDSVECQDDQAELVCSIRRNAEHLLAIVNDVLDLSKIEAGKVQAERITTRPVVVVTEVASLSRHTADSKGISLDVVYASSVPEQIRSDPTRLRQILLNLVSNAIKFTQEGAVQIRVAYSAGSEQEPELEFAIHDTGIGMTEQQVRSVAEFNAFTQVDQSVTRRFGGSGLGLRISNSLAEILGGRLDVESVEGVGSTFRLILPVDPPSNIRMLEPEEASTYSPPSDVKKPSLSMQLDGVRVLLAEDGADNQRLIATIIRKAGGQVTVVEDGELACQCITSSPENGTEFDVILMDMQMPVVDGYTAAARLRQLGCQLPIVALTANVMEEDRQKCLDAGCDAYETKPINRPRMIETIKHFAAKGARGRAGGEERTGAAAFRPPNRSDILHESAAPLPDDS